MLVIIILGLFTLNVVQLSERYDHCIRYNFKDQSCKRFPKEYEQHRLMRIEKLRVNRELRAKKK